MGMPGAGKTTLANALGDAPGWPVHLDHLRVGELGERLASGSRAALTALSAWGAS